ncbi:MAG: hypothetical protein ACREUU_04325 [Gammaproteobacteria bacterium]
MASGANGSQNRRCVAELAARIMADEGVEYYHLAKRKAADRLGIKGLRKFPDNSEIAALLNTHQRLFQAQSQPLWLRAQRETALEAMRLLRRFDPMLAGPVLDGSAARQSIVCLHVFAETPEEVNYSLLEHAIPFTVHERTVRQNSRERTAYPCFRFMAGEVGIELVVFSPIFKRQAPLSPVDGKPMARADRAFVEALVSHRRGQ